MSVPGIIDSATWTSTTSPDGVSRIFTRALGVNEQGFYWSSLFGTGDLMVHVVIQPKEHCSRERMANTWITLKRRYPLLAARVQEVSRDGRPHFVLDERDLDVIRDDFTFEDITSADAVKDYVNTFYVGPRRMSSDRSSLLIVLRCSDASASGPIFHLLFHVAHVIGDGTAVHSVAGAFLDLLAGAVQNKAQPDLESRLRMVVAQEHLLPFNRLSMPRQRWRRAMASVLWENSQGSQAGGQTLPHRLSPIDLVTPARDATMSVTLTSVQTSNVLKSLRTSSHDKVTIGDVMPVLAQLGMARVLQRRYLRGEISEEEWTHRLRQPAHFVGPVSLRPYCSDDWIASGGMHEVMLCTTKVYCTLPFMPGMGSTISPAPTDSKTSPEGSASFFARMLSKQRFFSRAILMQRQLATFLQHPLFHELTLARGKTIAKRTREKLLLWQIMQAGNHVELPVPSANEPVLFCKASTFGMLDRILPKEYPLHRGSSKPTIRLLSAYPHGRGVEPAEIYIVAGSFAGRLTLRVYYDSNVWDTALVCEWLEEVREATLHYLDEKALAVTSELVRSSSAKL